MSWICPSPCFWIRKGPEIRAGLLKDGKKVNLETGNEFSLYLTEQEGDEHGTSITYQELSKDVKPGDTILIDDGLIGLTVKEITADATSSVTVSQWRRGCGQRKGVNVPDVQRLASPDVSRQRQRRYPLRYCPGL